ncbi:MAG: hypothetical protein AAGC47_15700, partial [Bacteroidota bacterium]
MIFLYAFVALWISWVWVDYFRLLDIYEPESLKYVLIMFMLGCCSVFVVFGFDELGISQFFGEMNQSM